MQSGELHAVQDSRVLGRPEDVEAGGVCEMHEGVLLILHIAEEYTQVSQLRGIFWDM
jgi:hypothetical protein